MPSGKEKRDEFFAARQRYAFGFTDPRRMAKGKRPVEPQDVRAQIDRLRREKGYFVSTEARVQYQTMIDRLEQKLVKDQQRQLRSQPSGRAIAGGMLFATIVIALIMIWALTSGSHDDYESSPQEWDETENPFE